MKIVKMKTLPQSQFSCSDLYVAAFLISKGIGLISIDKTDSKRAIFIFDDFEDRENLLAAFWSKQATVEGTYEKRIEELTNQKLLLEEKIGKPIQCGGVSFETALDEVFGYIKNPCEMWANGIFEDKRLVLRMVFTEHLVYNRKTGFETASFSLPIRIFQHFATDKSRRVEMEGIEPSCKNGCGRSSTSVV